MTENVLNLFPNNKKIPAFYQPISHPCHIDQMFISSNIDFMIIIIVIAIHNRLFSIVYNTIVTRWYQFDLLKPYKKDRNYSFMTSITFIVVIKFYFHVSDGGGGLSYSNETVSLSDHRRI